MSRIGQFLAGIRVLDLTTAVESPRFRQSGLLPRSPLTDLHKGE